MIYQTIILAAAKAAKVSGAILLAICTNESGLKNVTVKNDGGTPTYGICQVKYGTSLLFGYKGKPEGLLDPKENAKYAALYLKYQMDRYGDNCQAVSAFNAGRYNESKIKPGYPRNLQYVLKVENILKQYSLERLTCNSESEYAENNGP